MKTFMLLGVICLLPWVYSKFTIGEIKPTWKALHHPDGPEEDGILAIVKAIGEHPEVLEPLIPREKLDHLSPKFRELFMQAATQTDPLATAMCNGCVLLVDLGNLLVTFGLEFEDVREGLIVVCELVAPLLGYRGRVLCQPIIDNYGPHIVTILDETYKRGDYICSFLNFCGPEEVGITLEKRLKKPMIHASTKESHIQDAMQKNSQPKSETRPKRQTNTIQIAHMGDSHINPYYAEGAATTDCGLPLCCNELYDGEGSAGPVGWYKCNVPMSTIEGFVEDIALLDPTLAFYTGDNPPHSIWEESQFTHMNITKWLADTVSRTLPGKNVYPVIGNHEPFPANLYDPSRVEIQELLQVSVDVWGTMANFGEEQINTFLDSAYYTIIIHEGLRLLVFNSNYGYANNWYNILQFGDSRMQRMQSFMEDTLTSARANGEKVILMTHHPIGDGIIEYDEYISQITLEYQDVIVLDLCGHKHKDTWRLIYGDNGDAEAVMLAGPSLNSYDEVNPGFRIYHLDAETFELVNYDQYFFDITDAMLNGKKNPDMTFMYTATDFYEIPDLSPASWQAAVQRMGEDDDYFQKWYQMRTLNTGINGVCHGACKAEYLCELAAPTFVIYTQCVENNTPSNEGIVASP